MNNIHIFRTPWLKLVMCTLISLLCLNVSQAWATDQTVTLTFEGTGSYPNNSNWTCDGSGSSSYNHTASGSKCASLATTGPAYFTYANSLSNVKSVTLYFLRHSNSTKKPTFVVQGRAKTTDDWVDKKSSGAVDVGSKDSWKEVTITLDAAYSGYIRVQYTCESDAGRWIDDITITYTPASCDESPTIGNAQINTASNNGAIRRSGPQTTQISVYQSVSTLAIMQNLFISNISLSQRSLCE